MAIRRLRPQAEDYKEKRARAYPPVGEQLDALWKLVGRSGDDGGELPVQTKEMLKRIQEVKQTHPQE